TSPSVDMIVPVPGNYPVNTPFSLQIATYVGGAAYGNGDYSPGRAETDAGGAYDPAGTGVSLGMVAGQIMTLPAGYDFSIPSRERRRGGPLLRPSRCAGPGRHAACRARALIRSAGRLSRRTGT